MRVEDDGAQNPSVVGSSPSTSTKLLIMTLTCGDAVYDLSRSTSVARLVQVRRRRPVRAPDGRPYFGCANRRLGAWGEVAAGLAPARGLGAPPEPRRRWPVAAVVAAVTAASRVALLSISCQPDVPFAGLIASPRRPPRSTPTGSASPGHCAWSAVPSLGQRTFPLRTGTPSTDGRLLAARARVISAVPSRSDD